MQQLVLFALLGLGAGALIAGVALSLVLTYRGSGVINLAAGAVAMVIGYVFWSLRAGEYGYRFDTAPALMIALAASVALGLIMEFTAFRPLRTATPLAKLVASLGFLLIAQAALLLAFGSDPQTEPSFLPGDLVRVFTVTVSVDRFILAGIVVAVAVILASLYRWSRFGLSTRAAAENEVSAMLAGLSPDRLSLLNTVIAAVVAGMLGVLAAPLLTLDTESLPLIVVPALAAALLARFTSFLIACGAGLALGSFENILYYLSTQGWFPKTEGLPLPGVEEVVVFLVIVIAMYWRGAGLPTRGDIVEKKLPAVPRPDRLLRPALLAAIIGSVAVIVLPFDFRQAILNSLIGTVLVLSLVVITGFVGQISVMQLALSGIAGFAISHLATDVGITFPAAPLLGAFAATAVGLISALSALRIRGVTLSVVTLAAAVAIQAAVFTNSTIGGGFRGADVPPPQIFGFNIGNDASFRGIDGKLPSSLFALLILAATIVACLTVASIRRSNFGQRMLAVRSNERAAAAVGINVRNVKLAAFCIGSFIAGLAGAMYAYNFGSISATRFGALTALSLIAFAYIGGITMVSGAIIAGFLATEGLSQHAVETWFGVSGTWTILLAGITLIFNLVFYPEGIAGANYKKKQHKKQLRAAGIKQHSALRTVLNRRRGNPVPPATAPAPNRET